MKSLVIARTELVRLFRDRANIFFVLVLPLLLVVLIGASFGGGDQSQIGLVSPPDDPAAEELTAALDRLESIETVAIADRDTLVAQVSRGLLTAGLLVPDGYTDAVAAGEQAIVRYVGRPDTNARSVRSVIEAVVAERAAVAGAAQAASEVTAQPVGELTEVAGRLRDRLAGVDVVFEEFGEGGFTEEIAGLGRFDLGASSQLFLFVFLNAMTSGAALIQTRQYGIARRMLATPTSMPAILAGQAAGRFLVALVQAAYIVVATAVLFGVSWGDPLATGAVVVLFSLAAAGAGMLIGSVFRNDSQAGGAGVGLGLVLAALGGSMMSLELFPATMRAVAWFTPHAWANQAMAEIVRRGGGVGDVLPQLGALSLYAVGLLTLSTGLLRRTLTR